MPFNLSRWLKEQSPGSFPGETDRDYAKQYSSFEDYMFREVHPEVEKYANIRNGGLLNNHGPIHIRTVIERASSLLGSSEKLTAHEAFLLLCAIHLHDVGNIFGREGHEKRLNEIVSQSSQLLGGDVVEIRMIKQIASAHGGKNSSGVITDSIGSSVPEVDQFLGADVRLQALASILRFADELADDTQRASNIGLQLDQIPASSFLYHVYAKQLHSVKVLHNDRTISLKFNLDAETAVTEYEKSGVPTLLLDEIYSRILKMHRELIYCSRFMRDIVRINSIHVAIEVFLSQENISPWETIRFSSKESGYPDSPSSIASFTPPLTYNGTELKERILAETSRSA